MKKFALTTLLLIPSTTAQAWTLPDFGHTYFVGSTEELDDIRAALRQAECERVGPTIEWCVMGGSFCGYSVGCHQIPNPYCGTNTYPCGPQAQMIPEGFGLGAVDCMQAYENYELWPTTETIGSTYLGNTYSGTYVPSSAELSSQSELPAECIAHMEQIHCLSWGLEFAELLCPDP